MADSVKPNMNQQSSAQNQNNRRLSGGNDGKGGAYFSGLEKKRSNSIGNQNDFADQTPKNGMMDNLWSKLSGNQR